jgi:hypothetical protein
MDDITTATDSLLTKLDEETNCHWTLKTNEDDFFRAITEVYQLDILRVNGAWTMELYEFGTPEMNRNEPQAKKTNLRNKTEITNALPYLLPRELRI